MPLKRPAASSAVAKAAKVAKVAKAAKLEKEDPVARKIRTVAEAVRSSDYPDEVRKMVVSMLEHSLALTEDQRHKFQIDTVSMVQEIVSDRETGTQKKIDEISADIDKLKTSEQDKRTAAVTEATEQLAAETSKLAERKETLAKEALAFKSAKAAVATSSSDIATSEQAFKDKQAEQERLETANSNLLQPLIAGAENAKDLVNQLLTVLKAAGFDQSLLISIPNAFIKDVASRGPFDTMVVSQVNEEVTKRLADLNAAVSAASAEKKRTEQAAENSTTQLEASREKQFAAAASFKESQARKKDLDNALKSANQSLKGIKTEANKLNQELAEAQLRLGEVQLDLASFTELKTRKTLAPSPVEEEKEEEEADKEPSDNGVDEPAEETAAAA